MTAVDLSEASSLILAVGSILTLATTFWLNRRGQNNEQREQTAAQALSARAAQFTEATTAVTLAREDADRERARAERAETRLDTTLERCDATQREAREALVVMRDALLDEVAKAAGVRAIAELDEHMHQGGTAPSS